MTVLEVTFRGWKYEQLQLSLYFSVLGIPSLKFLKGRKRNKHIFISYQKRDFKLGEITLLLEK